MAPWTSCPGVLVLAVVLGIVLSGITIPPASAGPTASASGTAYVRVNQIGYEIGQPKLAILMSSASEGGATYALVSIQNNTTAFSGGVGSSIGKWSSSFPYTYALNFSSIEAPGMYEVEVSGPLPTVSPAFTIGTGAQLYDQALANALFFYEVQQDGPNVNSSALDRQPSHLTDEHAMVYAIPTYKGDTLQGNLTEIGGPVNVSGGWFDAGDYLKFVETASYTTAMMLFAVRQYPNLTSANPANFRTEAMGELTWLMEMWNESTLTLYYQVGIGDGNSKITGDHDLWRLPQADDKLNVTPGEKEYYIKYRPVFEAGPAGSPVSPNLAGRLAADFGLCYQVFLEINSKFADTCLKDGQSVFDLANLTYKPISNKLLTTSPYNYYPQTSWQDDLELGATELALAMDLGQLPPGLPHESSIYYLRSAANWSHAYITGPENGTDTLNLYDVSGLADYELYNAIVKAGDPTLAVTKAEVLGNLGAEVETGVKAATHDPFGLGLAYNSQEDLVPHALGLAIEAALYDKLAGNDKYGNFGDTELGWVLGENAWGSSFIVGDGSTFPDCMQHQIANLVGSLNGTPPIDYGATVDGPTSPVSNLKGLGSVTGMRACPVGGGNPFRVFNSKGAAYEDNVVAWPTVEPADDYTAPTIVLFAMQIAAASSSSIVSAASQ